MFGQRTINGNGRRGRGRGKAGNGQGRGSAQGRQRGHGNRRGRRACGGGFRQGRFQARDERFEYAAQPGAVPETARAAGADTCPMCDKHCPLSAPACKIGRNYAASLMGE